ncbi:helix-turn-helix domain-containing protein [Gordonia rhizosphera]|uniref:Putative AraC family transcriptional regulator n=1 Tax=Gordonia rhizosphera NBRC 16068 TaxID=1108045 RepID=K6WWY9_9ACTN|nr:helix-turn-helix domain-containing protein [Gordonia rhizosphera]GAB91084.1 putative AraC family transcriptional regulator [Gordonia rhizosphera NBRC 16068]
MTTSVVSGYAEQRAHRVPATLWWACHRSPTTTILPDGCMDLIWTGESILVAGPDTGPVRYRVRGSQEMIGIRFDPGAGPAVLGVAGTELRDARVPLDEVWARPDVERWLDAMSTGDPADVLTALARSPRTQLPRWLPAVVSGLAAGRPVDACADMAGMSTRTLHRHSLRYLGYGPKTLQRILRMRAAAAALRAGGDLSEVAARRGFADYAHMWRDFVDLTGRSPVDFTAAAETGATVAAAATTTLMSDQPRAQ